MDLTKRKIFLLLLGASGVTLIVLANLFEFGSTHEVFLVAANFHNSSLSYLTSLNLNLGILPDNNKRVRSSLVSKGFGSNLDELVRNPKFNITEVRFRHRKKHKNILSPDDAAINRSNNGSEIDTVTKVISSDSINDWDASKSRVNNDSPDSDNSVKVGENTKVTNSAINDNQVSVKSRPNNSYIETRRTYDIKTKPVFENSQSQNALNNDYNSNINQQILKQKYLSKLTHETEISNRAKNGLEKGLLYRNRSVYGNKPPQEVKQIGVDTENVKDKSDNELIREEVLIPPEDNREINVVNNVYNLPKREESVTDNDKVDGEAFKPSSNQNESESKNIFETISQRDEVDRTENTQNHQVNTGDIPPEILQKYMKNNEQIANDGDFELFETKASVDNKRDRFFNDNGRNLNSRILQDNNILPQNNQEAMGNTVFHQTVDIPDNGQMEIHDNGIPDNYRQIENQADQDKGLSAVEGFSLDTSCSRGFSSFEDILCMKRPQFLPDFRNPCWYQHGTLRCLPYFHIIGVCKTGTTDLFERLSHHPQILKNRGILGKETWYWTWRRYGHSNFYRSYAEMMTLNDFIDQFEAPAIESYTKRLPNGTLYHPAVTGHGDPMDFWDQSSWKRIPQNDITADIPRLTTPSLIKHVNPNIKLILILRDPIERLFSNYLHGQFGSTADEFHRDVVLSRALLKACTANRSMKSCLYDENIIRSLRVPISGSFYSVHIKEWLKVFPRKQIFITRTEAFAKSIANTLLGIFRFLRLDPLPTRDLYRIANMPHFYNTKAKETSGSIRPETIDILRVMFEPYNIELARILNDENFNFNNVS